ncbi:putative serine/threonine-protein kinase/receptor [Phytophthora citrophthora]|uniref:Serine/threonine-protein kinase/receptor n=1 Tax=Phytophthora citrophthora TaxID=4793 RepID=A0AAD9GS24_9STRA|nr:putative serine/threonine-protein kinase/receptor [Phytophthora citrophthora]
MPRQNATLRPSTMKAGVATALVLLIQGTTAQTCGLTTSTLSTSCNDACSQYEPCLAYSGSSCPSGASCITDNDCAIQCFSKALDDPDTFTFLVGFGSYESSQQSSGSSFKEQVLATPDETSSYAAASNDVVSNVSTIELQSTVTSFMLVGGTARNASVKSKVAKVTFGSDVISTQTAVSNVVLNNLDLSTPATLQQLPVILPTSLQNLNLANTLISTFPTMVANFTSLQSLSLDKNFITEIAATAALNSLVHLSFKDNEIHSFRAVFPNLVTLDLTSNNFTDVPASIYIHGSLQELRMKGNPLTSPWFTKDEAAFLTSLSTFDLENSDFTKSIDNCGASNQLKVHSLTVCISDNSNDDNDDSSEDPSPSSSSNIFVIVGAVIGGLLVLGAVIFAGIWIYRRRVRRHQTRHSKIVRESYFGGLSPPLARSPATKSYRGGRRTPVSGGPRFCSDYEDDDSNYSPRISTRSTHSNQSSTAYSLWNDEELLSLQVKYEEIEDIGTIGSGAFGIIWLVKYRGSQLLASKRLRSDQVTKQRTQAFIEEIKMVAPFDHPNIVRLVGCAWTIETDLQALFEYMEFGDLRDYLVDPSSPRHWSQELLQLAADVIEALVYVHSFTPPLVHRDLKSRNVLLSGDMKAKVTDFGASRYKSVDETMTAAVGTGRWLAPEVISGSNTYDQSVDVFSFGVVLSEMDTHSIPYDDVRGANGNRLNDIAILQLVATGQLRPKFGAGCPPELRMLAERCLDQDPTKRPPAHVVAYELRVIQRSHYTLL